MLFLLMVRCNAFSIFTENSFSWHGKPWLFFTTAARALGHLLVCLHRSLICLLHTACFPRALCCAHSFACSLAYSLAWKEIFVFLSMNVSISYPFNLKCAATITASTSTTAAATAAATEKLLRFQIKNLFFYLKNHKTFLPPLPTQPPPLPLPPPPPQQWHINFHGNLQ